MFALLLLLAFPDPQEAPRDDIVLVKDDDPAMEAAKVKGYDSLPTFFARFNKPARDEHDFMVKFDLLPGTDAEFIWAKVERHDGAQIIGTLNDVPIADGYRQGQRVTIALKDVIDWQYWRGNRLYGHYTTRILLDRMPPEVAASYRRVLSD